MAASTPAKGTYSNKNVKKGGTMPHTKSPPGNIGNKKNHGKKATDCITRPNSPNLGLAPVNIK